MDGLKVGEIKISTRGPQIGPNVHHTDEKLKNLKANFETINQHVSTLLSMVKTQPYVNIHCHTDFIQKFKHNIKIVQQFCKFNRKS
jgi:hypothetical protein